VMMSTVSGQIRRRRLAPVELLVTLFCLLVLASIFWSTAPTLTIVRALQTMILCSLAFVSVQCLGCADAVRGLSATLVLYVLGSAAISTMFGLGMAPVQEASAVNFRFSWFGVHPIWAGIYSGMAALLVLARCLFDPAHRQLAPRWKWLSWLTVASLIVVLVLSNSRGPLLGFLAAAGVVLWKSMRRGFARGLTAAILLFVLVAAIFGDTLAASFDSLQARDNFLVQRLLRGADVDQLRGLNGRLELWEVSMPLIAERPLFGYGYHGSRTLVFEGIRWTPHYAHNAYVQSLLDVGIVGALLLWGVIGSVFIRLLFRPLGAVTGAAWSDSSLIAVLAFILLVSISSEGLMLQPGPEAFVVFVAASVVGQSRRSVGWAFQPAKPAFGRRSGRPSLGLTAARPLRND
jgi:O-antigen ligase